MIILNSMTDIILEYKELLAQKLEVEQRLRALPKEYISKKRLAVISIYIFKPVTVILLRANTSRQKKQKK